MQILRCFLVACVASCALSVRGDNEAQIKARQALEKKLDEIQSQSPAAPPAKPAATRPSKPKATPVSKPTQPAPSAAAVIPASASTDPDALSKARDAMRLKMNDVISQESANQPATAQPQPVANAQPEPAPPAPVQPAPAPPQPATPPPATPAPAQPAASVTPSEPSAAVQATPEADSDAIAKAREAMRQKMQEVLTQRPPAATKPAPAPATPAPATPAPAPAAIPPVAAPATAAAPAPEPATEPLLIVPPGLDPELIAKARDAMHQRMQELLATPRPSSPPVALTTPPPRPANAPQIVPPPPPARPPRPDRVHLPFPELVGPPLPISVAQKQQLDQLLSRYKADEITPEEYHAQRAKILGAQ